MNLPQNIQKTDGSIARSFSQELGLNLELKTRRKTLWHTVESVGKNGFLMMGNASKIVAVDYNKISVFQFSTGQLIGVFSFVWRINGFFKIDEQNLLIQEGGLKFIKINIETRKQEVFDFSGSDYRSFALAFSTKYNWLTLEKPRESIELLNINTGEIDKKIDISELNDTINNFYFSDKEDCLIAVIRPWLMVFRLDDLTLVHKADLSIYGAESISEILEFKNHRLLLYLGNQSIVSLNLLTKEKHEYKSLKKYRGSFNIYPWGDEIFVKNQVNLNKEYRSYIMVAGMETVEVISSKTLNTRLESVSTCGEYVVTLQKNNQIQVFNKELDLVKTIDIPTDMGWLDRYNGDLRCFIFKNAIFDLGNTSFIPFGYDGKTSELSSKSDIQGAGYQVLQVKSKFNSRRKNLLFINLKTRESHIFDPLIEDLQIPSIAVYYLKQRNQWLIIYKGWRTIYDADKRRVIDHFRGGFIPGLILGSNCIAYNPQNGLLEAFNLETKIKFDYSFNYNYTQEDFIVYSSNHPRYALYKHKLLVAEKRNSLFLIEVFSEGADNSAKLTVSEFDSTLIMQKKKEYEIDDFIAHSHFKDSVSINELNDVILFAGVGLDKKLLKFYKINTEDLSYEFINEMEFFDREIDMSLSKSAAFMALNFEYEKNTYVLHIKEKEWLGTIENSDDLSISYFDETSNLFITNEDNNVFFYRLKPFKYIGNLYADLRGNFFVEILPDETSPNGWFYTNDPDKVNVLKTKPDGSEPEPLPVENEERQAFIKHHNRRDIVMRKLFEPEKYAEFVRLNASAEETAYSDMAIELKQVEAKKLS